MGLDRRERWVDASQAGLHFFALDDHRSEVATDASALEPGVAEVLQGQRIELAEVRGSLDGCAGQAQRRGRVAVVHAGVAVVLLVVQHLCRPAPLARDGTDNVGRLGVAHSVELYGDWFRHRELAALNGLGTNGLAA